MSVFKAVLAAFRPSPDALEIDRSATSRNPQTPRIHITTSDISSPISPDSEHPLSRSNSNGSSTRPATAVDFNKRLPLPPAEREEPMWRKIFRLWIPLDIWARFVVVLGFCEALMAAWGGMQIVLSGKLGEGKIWTVMAAILLTWGISFTIAGYCAFSILWGRWRNSPTATHFLQLTSSLLTILYSIASSLWFFYAFQSATKTRDACLATMISWDGQTVPAPEPWMDLCLRTAESYGRLQVGWGFVNGLQVYFMMLLVMWAAQQQRRLRQQRRYSNPTSNDYPDNKSFESLSDMEAASNQSENFERTVAERVEEYARKEKLEKMAPKTVDIGMKIPNFPMPNRTRNLGLGVNTMVGGGARRIPPTIPETIEEVLKSKDESLPRLSGASALSGAIPIALDLRNAPVMYGRAF
ncbi:hypothetical protein ABW19_dt0203575 [Dactylella cylindrospora]|nr:hypothetical protein ABW19_dt0203575 [Dactylella cylindrospora]